MSVPMIDTITIEGYEYGVEGDTLIAERYEDGVELRLSPVYVDGAAPDLAASFARRGPRGGLTACVPIINTHEDVTLWIVRFHAAGRHLSVLRRWQGAQ